METDKYRPSTISGMIAFMGTGYFSPKKPQDIRNIIKSAVSVLVLAKPRSTDEILLFVKETESIPPVTNDNWIRDNK